MEITEMNDVRNKTNIDLSRHNESWKVVTPSKKRKITTNTNTRRAAKTERQQWLQGIPLQRTATGKGIRTNSNTENAHLQTTTNLHWCTHNRPPHRTAKHHGRQWELQYKTTKSWPSQSANQHLWNHTRCLLLIVNCSVLKHNSPSLICAIVTSYTHRCPPISSCPESLISFRIGNDRTALS
jgi:hypothetical protein